MQTLELDECFAGSHINEASKKATQLATEKDCLIHFEFNGTHVTVQPGEDCNAVVKRWDKDREAAHKSYLESPEYAEAQKRRAEEDHRKRTMVMKDTSADEKEMREAEVPWPQTEKQLVEYIDSLVSRQHDYGTCVYAASMASVAAFYYISCRLGMTGFQASMADMDIIRRTRSYEGPFMLINAADALYPQYDLPSRLKEAMEKWKPWLKEQAEKELAKENLHTHPDVIAHWKKLVL